MYLKELEITGFKSFAKRASLSFSAPISAIVGPNGSGKSNIAEAFRFVLGEQSIKSMRGKRGEDLIFNGTPSVPKQAKAGVKVVFDNSQKTLPIDFDQVTLERVVHRDGSNQYLINGSEVRLKDIIELLASANIGSSGHHIISQGEADRILNASPKERKSMLEDALGLKVFQYKKIESERKLIKTEENIAQVQSLRKEIAPHIKFLKKQVEKIEEGKRLKEELLVLYREYLHIESVYIHQRKATLSEAVAAPKKRLAEIDTEILKAESRAAHQGHHESTEKIKELESAISTLVAEKETLVREQGRIEGQITSLTKIQERHVEKENTISVTRTELLALKESIARFDKESESITDLGALRTLIKNITEVVQTFLHTKTTQDDGIREITLEIEKHTKRSNEILIALRAITEKEIRIRNEIQQARQKLDEDKSSTLEAEKQLVLLMSEKNAVQQEISKHAIAHDTLLRDETALKQELTEAALLVGRDVLSYESVPVPPVVYTEPREIQQERHRKLERMKMKVEEIGASTGDDVVREYADATERDAFLIKEIEDLEKSSIALQSLIDELGQKIETRFHEGVKKINTEFQAFFELMFGGGSASITVIKTEARKRRDTDVSFDVDDIPEDTHLPEEAEEGIDIKVNLPRKKISSLMMLSGGERALTSIALLFAISQVNPPPFIILDETDAALDEANSRKYGDMIENLAKNSQLILITHNRETMGRAGILYGVTMNGGASQLLSVAFEEGTQWAK